jgi:hypothetical protein
LPLGRSVTQNLLNVAEAPPAWPIQFPADEDGLYRHAQLGVRFHDRIALPLSLTMLRAPFLIESLPSASGRSASSRSASAPRRFVDQHGQVLIRWRGRADVPPISAAAARRPGAGRRRFTTSWSSSA